MSGTWKEQNEKQLQKQTPEFELQVQKYNRVVTDTVQKQNDGVVRKLTWAVRIPELYENVFLS
jgi:hypothetical protein